MPKTLNLDEILKNNPQVDPEQLDQSVELFEELRNQGVSRRAYELVPPFAGRRVRVADRSSEDPRTIHLHRR
jgi:hypothetical protein